MQEAQKQNKPIFVYVRATWCAYSKKFESEVLTNDTVINLLNTNFILVAIDIDEQRDLAISIGVSYPPHELFLDKNGNIITRIPGYVGADSFIQVLNEVINILPKKITVCPSGCTYNSIQNAIDSANIGDTIEVQSGTYFENVDINKQLILRGVGNPIVDASGSGSAITIIANETTLEGFIATNSGNDRGDSGIRVLSSNNTLIGNNIMKNYHGIVLESYFSNTLSGNTINENIYNFNIWGWYAGFNNNINIDTSNTIDGKPIYYINGASNAKYDNTTNAGVFYCIQCNNITIKVVLFF